MYWLFAAGSVIATVGLIWRVATGRSGLDELAGGRELFNLGFIVVTAAFFVFYRRVRARERRFRDWLEWHAVALRDGATVETLRGREVDASTRVRTYEALAGIGFGPWQLSTRTYLPGESAAREAWVFGLTTFLLGWWSFPRGPIKTVRSLAHTLRGGRRQRLGDLLPPPS
jgi:hypothetical protein